MPENPSDNAASSDEDLAPVADPAQAAPPIPPSDPAPAAAARLSDRVFRFRAVLAVAAAGVIVGGAAGAGLTALADGHGDGRSRPGRFGFAPGHRPGMSGGMPGMPGGQGLPGQGLPGQGLPGQGLPGQGLPGGPEQGLQGRQPRAQQGQDTSGSVKTS